MSSSRLPSLLGSPELQAAARKDPQLATLLMEQLRREVRSSLVSWSTEYLRQFNMVPARHHLKIIDKLEKIATGEIDRLMILAPPGSAKSTYATVLFPSWWF